MTGGPPPREGEAEGASAQRAQVTQPGGDIAAWSGPRGHAPGERATPPRNKSAEGVARETDVGLPEGAIRQPGNQSEAPVEELHTLGAIPPAPPTMQASDVDPGHADDSEKEKPGKGTAPDERPGNEEAEDVEAEAEDEEAEEKKGGKGKGEDPRVEDPRSEKEKAKKVKPEAEETEVEETED